MEYLLNFDPELAFKSDLSRQNDWNAMLSKLFKSDLPKKRNSEVLNALLEFGKNRNFK